VSGGIDLKMVDKGDGGQEQFIELARLEIQPNWQIDEEKKLRKFSIYSSDTISKKRERKSCRTTGGIRSASKNITVVTNGTTLDRSPFTLVLSVRSIMCK
jgi:hypothetical protein